MPRNQGTSRKGKPGKVEKASGMGRSLLIKNKYRPRQDGKNIYGGMNGMAAIPGVTSIGVIDGTSTNANNHHGDGIDVPLTTTKSTGTHPRSILDIDDLDDFLLQANLAEREFLSERGQQQHQNHVRNDEPIQIIASSGQVPSQRGVQWEDEQQQQQQQKPEAITTVMELSVPRRPPWTTDMTREELEIQEKNAFLQWRRTIAQYEAQTMALQQQQQNNTSSYNMIASTPFEKNLNVWRQLWRVIERSNVIIQIVDCRNPLFYISYDLYHYVTYELHKPMILLFNKSDYLSKQQRKIWKQYFTRNDNKNYDNQNDDRGDVDDTTTTSNKKHTNHNYPHHHHTWTKDCQIIFFSAVKEQKKLDVAASIERKRIIQEQLYESQQQQQTKTSTPNDGSSSDDDDDADDEDEHHLEENSHDSDIENDPSGDDHHIDDDEDLQEDADEEDEDDDTDDDDDVLVLTRDQLIETMRAFAKEHNCQPDPRYDNRIQYGMVGFPNVGKSSVINVLVGSSKHTHNTVRVAVASQPGKTKHFQTLLLHDHNDIMLCDCPGLVFPSFVSNTADLIAAGVYPISQMRDHWPVTNLICQRIPRDILNAHYGISLPILSKQQLQDRGYTNMNQSSMGLPSPTAEELLTTFCIARGLLASFSGVPDFQRASRLIIKDYADGKLLYCHPPPNMDENNVHEFYNDTIKTALRNTQKTRDRLIKQQQKQQALENANEQGKRTHRNGKINNATTNKATKTKDTDVVDDELIQMIAAATIPTYETKNNNTTAKQSKKQQLDNNSNSHKHHFKKTTGAKWGKKDRKNRNKDPYGCHTSTPDSTLLSMM